MAFSFTKYDVIRALMKGDTPSLLAALKWIGEAGEDPALAMGYVDGVGKFIHHTEPAVQAAACVALGNMGMAAEGFVSAIAALLTSPIPAVRAAAVTALGSLASFDPRNEGRVATIAEDDTDRGVKVAAITALGDMRADAETELLKKLLKSEHDDIACAAVLALAKLGALADEGSLLSGMIDKPRTRHAALTALSSIGLTAPVMCLEKVVSAGLSDKDSLVRELAVKVIGCMPEAAAEDATIAKIKGMLKSDDAGQRAAAAMALGAIGPDAANESAALVPLLSDKGEDKALAHLALSIGSGAKKASAAIRFPSAAALSALGSMKASGCLEQMTDCLNDSNYEVRLCAVESIAALGTSAAAAASKVTVLLTDVAYPVRAAACSCLGAIGAEDEVEEVVGALKDKSASVRLAALLALIDLGEAAWAYSHDVFKLIKDDTLPCRQGSIRCLSLMGEIGGNYAGVAAMMLNDDSAELRCEACESLGRMGVFGAAFAEDVSEKLSDRSPMVAEAAGRALMAMGNEGKKFLYMQGYLEPPSLEDTASKTKLPPVSFTKAYMSDLERERARLGL